MRDVLARLIEWIETSDVQDADIVLRDAITEIAGLRARLDEHRLAIRRLADQDATLSVVGGNVTVTMDATLTAADFWNYLASSINTSGSVGERLVNCSTVSSVSQQLAGAL